MLRSKMSRIVRVYSDGASRGNPGPSAIAVKIFDENGVMLKKVSKYVGRRTNNEAEYEALVTALKLAHDFTEGVVHCFLDSQLVVKQLNGEYQVRNSRLESLWLKVRELQHHFQEVTFTHVLRTDKNIRDVDKMANRFLDRALG